MYNPDLIEHTDTLYFGNYQEFKKWYESKYTQQVEEFISQPIEIVDEEEGLKFGRIWDLVDRFQSGTVMYLRRK